MSLLSGFVNPWESGGALDSGVLSDNALNSLIPNSNRTSKYIATFTKGKDNQTLKADIKAYNVYKVINCSSKEILSYVFNASATKIKSYLERRFRYGQGIIENINIPYDFDTWKQTNNKYAVIEYTYDNQYTFEFVDSLKQIKRTDLIVVIVNSIGRTYVKELDQYIDVAGFHGEGNRILTMEVSQIKKINYNAKRIIAHEEGHRLGLPHACNHKCFNLMSYFSRNGKSGSTITQEQRDEIGMGFYSMLFGKFIKKVQKNKNITTVSNTISFGDARSDINDYLSSSSINVDYELPNN